MRWCDNAETKANAAFNIPAGNYTINAEHEQKFFKDGSIAFKAKKKSGSKASNAQWAFSYNASGRRVSRPLLSLFFSDSFPPLLHYSARKHKGYLLIYMYVALTFKSGTPSARI